MARDRHTEETEKPGKLIIGVYLAATLLYYLSLYLYVPTLPTYVHLRVQDLSTVGLVLSMYGLWQALIRIPTGIGVDTVGWGKPFLLLGFILAASGALCMAFGGSVFMLAVGRALTGLAAGTWVPLTVVFMNLFPAGQTVFASSMLMVAGSIGRVTATGLNGSLNSLGGYRLAFFCAAAAAVAAALLIAVSPERRRPPARLSVRSLVRLLLGRDLLIPTVISTIYMFANWAVIFSFMPLLAQSLGANDVVKGLLMALYLALFTVGNLLNTFIAKRIRYVTLLLLTLFGQACGIVGAALSGTVALLFVFSGLTGLSNGFTYPTLMGMSVARVDASQRTTAMGLHQAVYAIGMFTGPWIGGILADAVGIRWMFAAIAGVLLGSSYVLLLAFRSRPAAAAAD